MVKDAGADVLGSLGIGVTVADAVKVAGSRAAADQVVLEPAAPDDVARGDARGRRQALPAGRAGARAAGCTAGPGGCQSPAPSRSPPASPSATAPAGVGDWAIEGLRLIGIDLAGKTAASVARAIDEHQVPKPGLYRWRGRRR